MNNENFFTRLARLAMLNVGFGSPSNSGWTENLVNWVAFGGIPNLPFKQILLFIVLNVLIQIRSLTKKIPKLTLSLPVSRLRVGHIRAVESLMMKQYLQIAFLSSTRTLLYITIMKYEISEMWYVLNLCWDPLLYIFIVATNILTVVVLSISCYAYFVVNLIFRSCRWNDHNGAFSQSIGGCFTMASFLYDTDDGKPNQN